MTIEQDFEAHHADGETFGDYVARLAQDVLDGVTEGPWTVNQTYPVGDWLIHAKGIPWKLAYLADDSRANWPLEANARFIAASREIIPALLADRARLMAERDRLREGLERISNYKGDDRPACKGDMKFYAIAEHAINTARAILQEKPDV